MSYLVLYLPICIVILLVLAVLEEDDPRLIVKKAISKFFIYTAMLAGASAIIGLISRYL